MDEIKASGDLFCGHIPYAHRYDIRKQPVLLEMSGLTWRALPMLPQNSMTSSYKVSISGRWLGLMSIHCKSYFHTTIMKKRLVNPSFKGWREWEKYNIKIQTLLLFCCPLKPMFPTDQTTSHFNVNIHLCQVHSYWVPLELIIVSFRGACLPFLQQTQLIVVCCSQEGGEGCSGNTKSLEWPL